jgi:Flp pilus assembly pilin Flp
LNFKQLDFRVLDALKAAGWILAQAAADDAVEVGRKLGTEISPRARFFLEDGGKRGQLPWNSGDRGEAYFKVGRHRGLGSVPPMPLNESGRKRRGSINLWAIRTITIANGEFLTRPAQNRMMRLRLLIFWHDDKGQDLIEYTLLMAFVALGAASLFIGGGRSIKGIWTTANSQLTQANSQAS